MRIKVGLRPARFELETGRMDELYRAATRKQVERLLAENRALRHGKQPREWSRWVRLIEALFLRWLERRYPIPEGRLPDGGAFVVEAGRVEERTEL